MRRILVGGTAMLFALSSFLLLPGEGQEDGIRTAEASATIRVANRELKRNKRPPMQTDIYERAHRIIWSGGKSYDDRVRIAVVINGDENIIVEDRVKNQVYSQLRNKFPRENFAVMKGTDVNTKLLQYAEDVRYANRDTFGLKCDDYVRAGRECSYDYVFSLTFHNSNEKTYTHALVPLDTNDIYKNVWTCVRFVDVANGEYMYRNDIVTKGKTYNGYGYIRGRTLEHAVKKAVQEAMDDIAIDY